MIDDDDVDFAILATSGWTGWMALVGIAVVIVFIVIAMLNHDECDAQKCAEGQRPKLMHGECLCVTPAKKGEAK